MLVAGSPSKIQPPMATLRLIILRNKPLKDGRHKVRVALSHHHQTAYIATSIIVDNEGQFRGGLVCRRKDAAVVNCKLRDLLQRYQDRLDSLPDPDAYSCTQLRDVLKHAPSVASAPTFAAVSERYERELVEAGSTGYATLIARNRRYFAEFLHGDIHLSDITPETVEYYSRFLRLKKGLGEATNMMLMRITKTIVNKGVKFRLVDYAVHPFVNFRIAAAPVRELDLTLETFNAIRAADPAERKLRVARDLFLLSFYLGGINLIDLLAIDFRGKERVEYIRTKSRTTTRGVNRISIALQPEAREIVARWMDRRTGRLEFGYKFTYRNFSRYLSRLLDALARSLGLKEKVVYYSARKSFAQYASEIGIPDGVIDYCLGHSDHSRGVLRYYTKVRQRQADLAIARVIDYVKHPEQYRDYLEMRRDIMLARL